MENRNSYTIVGLFVMLIGAFLGIFMWWMLTRTEANETYRSYFIHTKELPVGIKEGADVKFIGVNAGIVKKIDFIDMKNAIIEIELSIKDKLPISKDSIAKVESQGISGISFINITQGSGEIFNENEKKPIISLDKALLDKIGKKAEVISDQVSETIYKINMLLSNQNIDKINKILTNFETFSKKLNDEKLTKNIYTAIDEFIKFQKTMDNSAKKFNNFIDNLNKTQNKISARIDNGDFNIREILNPTLSDAQTTLNEFNKALIEFESALFRLEDNPYEFFFKDTGDTK
ncbi:MlaD family protein [Campylobacter hominis]|uniref:Putative ABC transport system periplasmic substrate-binding protein n=1 Tax=Campylobacter hominis (strain ATCC BAA-381 / DSM 21671 / CCUG 45161 / LMG 19568 / NCTC 13146 / CH001A) TaxID=360107 RepID=A7I0X2_CAMHC|nr:MlaD family protein [Campylobacter hominis]ABS51527.1 putative ABC transport system periplasmic substrate-binding protein [Campylobacter hominis ATCC BAA-381]UAK86508.1 MlaD family protein [Campylobacter hominis]SUW84703.1 putative ABC transport system periplasmic substrate-binding protein [Campylobacter hominis]